VLSIQCQSSTQSRAVVLLHSTLAALLDRLKPIVCELAEIDPIAACLHPMPANAFSGPLPRERRRRLSLWEVQPGRTISAVWQLLWRQSEESRCERLITLKGIVFPELGHIETLLAAIWLLPSANRRTAGGVRGFTSNRRRYHGQASSVIQEQLPGWQTRRNPCGLRCVVICRTRCDGVRWSPWRHSQ